MLLSWYQFFLIPVSAQDTAVSVSTEMELLDAIGNAGTTPAVIDVTENIAFSSLSFLGGVGKYFRRGRYHDLCFREEYYLGEGDRRLYDLQY